VAIKLGVIVAIGSSVLALLANSSAYFFPTNDTALVFGGMLLVAVAFGALREARAGRAGITLSSLLSVPPAVTFAAALGLWLSFWPLSFVGPGYLGYLQTDSAFCATAANTLQNLWGANSQILAHGMYSVQSCAGCQG
jgi:hypothetical protein